MPPFFTRTGDDGTTSLLGGKRLSKDHPRIEALGALDEASAFIGFARSTLANQQERSILTEIQLDLQKIMAEIAATPGQLQNLQTLGPDRVHWLEETIRQSSAGIPKIKRFIVPGDTPSSAAMSLARTVVRRAERRLVRWIDPEDNPNPCFIPYLNRLSSLCFVLELIERPTTGQRNVEV